MDEYISSSSICLYLSMPAGEVQSYILLQNAFDNKKRVFIPKVMGKSSADLKIFELENYSMIDEFPRSKWGIPEPPKDFVQKSADATSPAGIERYKQIDELLMNSSIDVTLLNIAELLASNS